MRERKLYYDRLASLNCSAALTRRRLLKAGALGGAAAVAGCLGDDPENPDGPDEGTDTPSDDPDLEGVHVEGQTLRVPVMQNPDEMTFFWYPWHGEFEVPHGIAHQVRQAVVEPGMWGRWWNQSYHPGPGPEFYQLYEYLEINERTIEFKIRDDAYWSDGEPVTAYDAYAEYALRTRAEAPIDEVGWFPTPNDVEPFRCIYEGELPDGPDGKTVIWHVQPTDVWLGLGGFHAIDDGYWYDQIAGPNARAGTRGVPMHVEPYKSMAEDAVAKFEEKRTDESVEHVGLHNHVVDHMVEEDIYRFREGENVVTNGVWTIDEIVGTEEVVLKPNEYHRLYDEINYDEVILEYSPEDNRTIGSLHSGRLDWAVLDASPEVAESFPDFVEELQAPANSGYVIGVDHASAFGDVRVRQAMMFALHTPDIAENIHPTAAAPIITPGWDTWASEAILDEEWARENLISYEQDLDQAAGLMEAAGFELNSNDVWEKDGEPLQAQLATNRETPAFEETVASQLREFGIDVHTQPYDNATFNDRAGGSDAVEYIEEEYAGAGDFDLWAGDNFTDNLAGFYDSMWRHFYIANVHVTRTRARNYFAHDVQEEILQHFNPANGFIAGQTDLWLNQPLYIPPFGEPDGELEPFDPVYLAGMTAYGPKSYRDPFEESELYDPPHDEPHDENAEYFYKKFAWTVNWFLPGLPLVMNQNQHFLNTANWRWPNELGGEANEYMWDYFGVSTNARQLAAMNRVLANPDNPKDGANVVNR